MDDPREGVHFMTKSYDEVCGTCRRRFNNPAALQVHTGCLEKRLIHLSHPFMKYECFQCKKKFKTLSLLRQHVTFHLEKMYHCLLCGTDHYTKQQVIRHVQCEHNRIKSFSCNEPGCNKQYAENRHLRRHQNRTGHGFGSNADQQESVYVSGEESIDESLPSSSPESPEPAMLQLTAGSLTSHEPETTPAAEVVPITDDNGNNWIFVPIAEVAGVAAAAAAASGSAVSPAVDQLTEFVNFQKFLSLMRHCAECSGYFLSDSLLQDHCRVHHTPVPQCALPQAAETQSAIAKEPETAHPKSPVSLLTGGKQQDDLISCID